MQSGNAIYNLHTIDQPHHGNFNKRLIKSGQTLNRDFFTSLERWTALAGAQAENPTLIYGGQAMQKRRGIRVLG